MFLEKLSEREKEVFLDLARATAKANGMVEDSEKEMIRRYCREMSMDEHKIYDEVTVDEAAEFLKESSSKVRNIIIVELMILCSADGEKDKEEKKFVKDLAEKIGISLETYDILKKDVKAFHEMIHDMKKHIKEKE
ncbi:MAG: hypothetical protein IIZ41_01620 [Lachnospiraceae bacterium]|nr:hypothetical protein [Lachnospiraceae bacterium]